MKKVFACFAFLVAAYSVEVPAWGTSTEAAQDNTTSNGREYTIEGNIAGIRDGTVITLYQPDGRILIRVATDTVMNGRFFFRIETDAGLREMRVYPQDDNLREIMFTAIWAAPGAEIKITGDVESLSPWKVESDVPRQIEENLYRTDEIRDILGRYSRANAEHNELHRTTKFPITDLDELNRFRQAVGSLTLLMNSLEIEQHLAEIEIMERAEVSPIWLDKLEGIAGTIKYSDSDTEGIDALREKATELYVRLSEAYKNTTEGYFITAALFPPAVAGVGDSMADADLVDVDGNTARLADHAGKWMLIDFWNSGCGPCIEAFPEMKELSITYAEKLTIVSVSLDSDSAWRNALAKFDTPWVNVCDPKSYGGLAAHYGVMGTPHFVIISPEGRIVDSWGGYGNGLLRFKLRPHLQ
jgi:thiol-disulfide isomerase/thioredoxin